MTLEVYSPQKKKHKKKQEGASCFIEIFQQPVITNDSQACVAQAKQGGTGMKLIFFRNVTATEVPLGLLLNTLQKLANFSDGRTKTIGDQNFYVDPKTCHAAS